jgi:iron complex transport system permease protein
VLAGVVVGLAFSSVQTLMLSMAGHSVSNALSWLFGSFANVSWNQVFLILIPGLSLALVPLIWAKEFNLVLLGEDQAQQMGLNVRRFNRVMLIMASILTSLCVAFVGIIGFVGLVIPHLCRMMLGGDHRLVLPASIAFGGALMMVADLAARTLYLGIELPVGAITTMIGVPVFAYLLIRRGRMYEG